MHEQVHGAGPGDGGEGLGGEVGSGEVARWGEARHGRAARATGWKPVLLDAAAGGAVGLEAPGDVDGLEAFLFKK